MFKKFIANVKKVDNTIWSLFVVQFFTWLGLFSLWIYITPVITKEVFNAVNSNSGLFKKGVNWVAYCFALYSFFAATFAFFLHRFYSKIGLFRFHAASLFIGGIGLLLIGFIQDKWLIFFPFLLIGIGWSSISNIPYKIIGKVASDELMEFSYSIFSFSVVIPQVVAATFLGYLTENVFFGHSKFTLVFGGGCMMFSGVLMYLWSIIYKRKL